MVKFLTRFLNIENKESISLGGFNDLIKMRDGWMVYNKNDRFIGKSIKEYGEWSQAEIDLCKQILLPTDCVIEVGSNIGTHTLALTKIANEGIVFAFEPQNIVFQNLCGNISINSRTNCFCFQTALSEKNEDLYYPNYNFNAEQNFGAMSFLRTEKSNFTLKANVDTLDNRFPDLQKLKLIKTDAEGMEINIIKGGINLIKRTKPFLYLENEPSFQKSKDLIELLWSLEYRLFWHIIPYYSKNNFFKNQNNIFKNFYHSNILGVRKEIEIKVDLPEVKDSSFHPLKKN